MHEIGNWCYSYLGDLGAIIAFMGCVVSIGMPVWFIIDFFITFFTRRSQ
jgi:hypothetical protein